MQCVAFRCLHLTTLKLNALYENSRVRFIRIIYSEIISKTLGQVNSLNTKLTEFFTNQHHAYTSLNASLVL
jgi:hypothetical protein